jgi:hypothetical protein
MESSGPGQELIKMYPGRELPFYHHVPVRSMKAFKVARNSR